MATDSNGVAPDNFHAIDFGMHKRNRLKLAQKLSHETSFDSRSIMLFQGGRHCTRDETDHEPLFRQESSFQYLFGVREPDMYGCIEWTGCSTLFIPRLPKNYATWYGEILTPQQYKEHYGVDYAYYVDELNTFFKEYAPSKVYLSHGLNTDSGNKSVPAYFEGLENFETDCSDILYNAIVECRVIKSDEELAVMQYMNDISSDSHFEVMRLARPGMMEFQLESIFLHYIYYYGGCRFVSYTSICGCGPNSGVLHYGHAGAPNDRKIGDNDMLLLDMGGEYHCYGSDITCSFPSSGKFSTDQKMIFEAVAGMQEAVMSAMKPGINWKDMHTLSYRVCCEHLKAGGLLKGSISDMMDANIGAIFMPHGLGHLLGLDTHDVGGYPPGTERDLRPGYKSLRCVRQLERGMVITVEPGIYFIDHLLNEAFSDETTEKFLVHENIERFRGFGGVRLEDDVIITDVGIKNMTNCPRTVSDVEDVMSGKITNRAQLKKLFY